MYKEICENLINVKSEMEDFMKQSVPFWLGKGIDREYGGYMVCFDQEGKPMKELAVLSPTDKMIVTQTRMIWGFSALVRNGLGERFGWGRECREAADQGVDFFIEKFWDKLHQGWAWVTDREGNVLDNGKLVYGQTFAIYALAEYYLATGNERALEYGELTFDLLKKYGADTRFGGYFENFREDWTLERPGVYGGDLKSLDIHMHAMEAYTTLYEATHKEIHKRALLEVIDIILTYMVDYRYWCGRNQFGPDFTPRPAISIKRTWNYDRDPESANQNPLDTTSYGHNIELVWLLNRAYEVLGEPPARELTGKFADYTVANGWDREFGGIYRDGMHDGRLVVSDKEWWQNFEALTGFLDSYEATGEGRYLDTFIKLWEFDRNYFYNRETGESRQLLKEDGTPVTGDMGNQWKCIYHTDRAMMECCLRIEKLLKRMKPDCE